MYYNNVVTLTVRNETILQKTYQSLHHHPQTNVRVFVINL